MIDQVKLLENIPSLKNCKFSIVGHSFGGSVAMMAAVHFQKVVNNLILIEPTPFYLLKQSGYLNAYEESLIIQKKIKKYYNKNWDKAVHFFADYWKGWNSDFFSLKYKPINNQYFLQFFFWLYSKSNYS